VTRTEYGSDKDRNTAQVEAGWILVGAPLDCSGTNRGEARAPRALRDAGLVGRTGARDAGDVDATIDDPDRDARTGVIGFEQLRKASSEINSAVAAVLKEAGRPLVVGGDCAVLVGALAAAKERFGRVGLAFVDGHLDFFGGDTSPSGEAADMDLAFVTGRGPEGLVDLGGVTPPIAEPGDVVVMGYRNDPEEAVGGPREADLVDERVQLVGPWRASVGILRGWDATWRRGSRRKPGASGCTSTWTPSMGKRCQRSPTRCPMGSASRTRKHCCVR
jgi:arginase